VPVLLDVWHPGCGPCRQVAPILDQLAEELDGQAAVVKLNTDEDPGLAAELRVSAVPTFIVFSKGKEKVRLVGFHTKTDLVNALGI
jgi:thioredoxin 1